MEYNIRQSNNGVILFFIFFIYFWTSAKSQGIKK